MNSYDIIIIGSGPGGYNTAARAASSGLRTLLCERDKLGGTCLNRGCIPTKALCRTAQVAADMKKAAAFGVTGCAAPAVDFAVAAARKDEVVSQLRQGIAMLLKDVDVVEGEAQFISSDTIEIAGQQYTSPKIIVATGSRPARLDIPGADLAVDSDFLLSASVLPASIVIIGGGVIGLEFASILHACGVEVTVMEFCREILPPFDADVAKRLRMSLKRQGINIMTSTSVTAITPDITVEYESKGRPGSLKTDSVLMAVGRRPVIPEGLLELGVDTERGYIVTDDLMRTSVPGIYAVGDVNGRCMLAHAAEAQGLVVLGEDIDLSTIPSAVFTAPECAMAGPTEARCKELGLDIAVGQATFRANGKAMAMDEPDGVIKTIVERGSGRILACHICGAHAADLIAEPALAIVNRLTVHDVLRTVHAHPTLGEVFAESLRAIR